VSIAIQVALKSRKNASVGLVSNEQRKIGDLARAWNSAVDSHTSWLETLNPTDTAIGQDLPFGAFDPFNFMDVETYDFGTVLADNSESGFDLNSSFSI
jgi:hypothetical protein